GIEGVHRFLQKVWRNCIGPDGAVNAKISATATDSPALVKQLHKTIQKVGDDIDALRFNTAISAMMEFNNALQAAPRVNRRSLLSFLQLLAPFAPRLGLERIGEFHHGG